MKTQINTLTFIITKDRTAPFGRNTLVWSTIVKIYPLTERLRMMPLRLT